MLRTPAIAAIVAVAILCGPWPVSSQEGQPVRVDTVLVLKSGQEIRGQFVGFRNGLFTLRLPDGKITIHGVGDVDRMQPSAESQSATVAPAAAPPSRAPEPAPAAGRTSAPSPAPAAPTPPPTMTAPIPAPAATAMSAQTCGPEEVKFPTMTDKSQHPTPAAPPDKGLVYIVRPSGSAGRIQTRLSVNGTWVGANYANNYFFVTLDPGEHHFCSQADERNEVLLTVQAGNIYYLLQTVTTGMMKSRSSLEILSDQDGQDALTKSKLSVKREPKP